MQIINAATQSVHGVVNTTADNPTTIVWAPTSNAGIVLDANAAGFAPYAGPGPAQAAGPTAQPSAAAASASAPAPSSAVGAARASGLLVLLTVGTVFAVLATGLV